MNKRLLSLRIQQARSDLHRTAQGKTKKRTGPPRASRATRISFPLL
jgi:hypothetical protein